MPTMVERIKNEQKPTPRKERKDLDMCSRESALIPS